ncbi:ABC transporter ATP-binding protein [Advenella faeciporci]|uniref:Glutathione import ATP-binding protein GsiA n=1 Tax=Advenella faeciporci TaxID=797535 RepID=A0A918MXT7_9BURK|nr:ABC transporter ATP-binding protein [Advenella faeciporci]GGW85466.1 ABC transporter ATP-binding protein [Advenella faeciporci]
MNQALISVSGLNVSFGANQVLHNVSFNVAAGECYGLVGESGSGKSTILKAIMGLNKHTGKIEIENKPLVSHKRDKTFYRKVQMVFQDPYGSIHPKHSIDRILSEPLNIQKFTDIETRVCKSLEDVGLNQSFRYRFPHQLSGGQRQRVAIARALITEPQILVMDEPTSALDVSVQSEILNLLDDLRQERNLTYILVSHNLAVIAHMCDKLAVMNHGAIVEEMTPDTLYTQTAKAPYSRELIQASHGYDLFENAA